MKEVTEIETSGNSIDMNTFEVFIFRHRAGWFIGQLFGTPTGKTVRNPLNRNETMEVEPDYVVIDNAYELMLKQGKSDGAAEFIFVPMHYGLSDATEHKIHFDDLVFKSTEPHHGIIPTLDVKREYLKRLLITDTQEKKRKYKK